MKDKYAKEWSEHMAVAMPFEDFIIMYKRRKDWNVPEDVSKEMKKIIDERRKDEKNKLD
jgi:hypothetical protein